MDKLQQDTERLVQQQQPANLHVMPIFQCTPWVPSVVYVGGTEVILKITNHLYPPDADWAEPARFITFAPLVIAWTHTCEALWVERHAHRATMPGHTSDAVVACAKGTMLGAGAYLMVIGVAAAKDWIQSPTWGWKLVPTTQLVRGLLLTTGMHASIVVSEELIFRGFVLDAAMRATRPSIGVTALTVWFALGHGFDWQVVVGQSALGLALTALRLYSNSLWLPIGYHFGWNIIQTAVLGSPTSLPSLRPMDVHGPKRWVGQHGRPFPGLLMALINTIMAVVVTLFWRQRKKRFQN